MGTLGRITRCNESVASQEHAVFNDVSTMGRPSNNSKNKQQNKSKINHKIIISKMLSWKVQLPDSLPYNKNASTKIVLARVSSDGLTISGEGVTILAENVNCSNGGVVKARRL